MANLKYTDVMKPEDISIANLWTVFAGAVMDAGAPQMQRDEMRKSFYAGFVECFKIITDLSDVMTEAEAVKTLERLKNESHAFFETMIATHPRITGGR